MSELNANFGDVESPLAVLTSNYGQQLTKAMDDPPVTWASDAGWVTAKNLVDQYGKLPLYIRGTEEEAESHLVTHLGVASAIANSTDEPQDAADLKEYLVQGDIMHSEGDEYSHYIRVDNCWALDEPFPQNDLILDSQKRPVDRNYSRNYAIVQPRKEDI